MKIIKWLDDHFEEYLLIILSATMVFVIALQVFMRFIIGSSLIWSEELARYCFIWLVYIGISYGVKKQRHIKVDIVLLALKDRGKIILGILANIIFFVFAIFIIINGYVLSSELLSWGQTSPALDFPMGVVYLATPVGMSLTAIRIIQQIIKQIRTLLGHDNFEMKPEHEHYTEIKD
ncbi:TRAP transporter small permease [Salipaludibacillus sp. CF4.18]|uniref:TRAP transporter small permease n=1 Tax=Salipaludibacillus sp. CF4.18 TaxID=3373081 RepID=UPI003EE5CBE9